MMYQSISRLQQFLQKQIYPKHSKIVDNALAQNLLLTNTKGKKILNVINSFSLEIQVLLKIQDHMVHAIVIDWSIKEATDIMRILGVWERLEAQSKEGMSFLSGKVFYSGKMVGLV